MPRGPRIDFPGAFHHVYGRGIEKREIFRDDVDRKEFRRRILLNLKRTKASCLAWVFLPNHFHLLFHSEEGVLSRFMHRLMSGYSMYFNKKHVRVGHLFQNRFRSSLIHSEPYLLEVIRYIHLNPVRAGVVHTLEDLSVYPWSGHRQILDSSEPLWADFPFLRGFFGGNTLKETRENYVKFLEMGLRADPSVSFSDGSSTGEERGHEDRAVASMGNEEEEGMKEFLRVSCRVCRSMGIPSDHLRRTRRDRISSNVRRAILKECVTGMGMPLSDVCSWLGITNAGGAYLLRTSFRLSERVSIFEGAREEICSGFAFPADGELARDHVIPLPESAAFSEHEKF